MIEIKQIKKVKLKNILPRKEKRRVCAIVGNGRIKNLSKEINKFGIKRLLKKGKMRINFDGRNKALNNQPILVDKIGRRWFKVIDGNHRYWKAKDLGRKEILVEIRGGY